MSDLAGGGPGGIALDDDRYSAPLLVLALVGIWALLVAVPLVSGVPPIVGGIAVTVLFTFAALAGAALAARLDLSPGVEFAGLILGTFDWYLFSAGSANALARLFVVPAADVLLIFALVLGGRLVSRILREPKMMLFVAVALVLADIFTVYFGFTGLMLENAPEVVEAVSLKLPEMGSAAGPEGLAGLRTMATLGPGDTFFAAMFFAVVARFGLGMRRSFWWIFGFVGVGLALIVAIPGVPPVPVLPLMTLGFVIPNWDRLKLQGAEWGYMLIAFVFLFLLFAGMRYLLVTVAG